MPIGTESASGVRVRVASGGDVGRFPFLRRPVDRRRRPPQEVLRPFGLSLFDRNAFRRGHSLRVVLRTDNDEIRDDGGKFEPNK